MIDPDLLVRIAHVYLNECTPNDLPEQMNDLLKRLKGGVTIGNSPLEDDSRPELEFDENSERRTRQHESSE